MYEINYNRQIEPINLIRDHAYILPYKFNDFIAWNFPSISYEKFACMFNSQIFISRVDIMLLLKFWIISYIGESEMKKLLLNLHIDKSAYIITKSV